MAYTTIHGKVVRQGKALAPARWPRLSAEPTPKLHPDKGVKGGRCNVTACQKPGANYFNKSTKRYYCEDCAREINWPGGRADTLKLYGVPLLCELEA